LLAPVARRGTAQDGAAPELTEAAVPGLGWIGIEAGTDVPSDSWNGRQSTISSRWERGRQIRAGAKVLAPFGQRLFRLADDGRAVQRICDQIELRMRLVGLGLDLGGCSARAETNV
jgi:hypothetical protein